MFLIFNSPHITKENFYLKSEINALVARDLKQISINYLSTDTHTHHEFAHTLSCGDKCYNNFWSIGAKEEWDDDEMWNNMCITLSKAHIALQHTAHNLMPSISRPCRIFYRCFFIGNAPVVVVVSQFGACLPSFKIFPSDSRLLVCGRSNQETQWGKNWITR